MSFLIFVNENPPKNIILTTSFSSTTISSRIETTKVTVIINTNKTRFAVTIIVTVSFIFSTSSRFGFTTIPVKWRCCFAILRNKINNYCKMDLFRLFHDTPLFLYTFFFKKITLLLKIQFLGNLQVNVCHMN